MGLSELVELVGWPLLAGLLATASHVPLGLQVIRRGVVFIDLAIAQIAGVTAMLASRWIEDGSFATLAALLGAWAGAILVAGLARLWPTQREATIGLSYVAAAALALVLVSAEPKGMQQLQQLLSGDILWVTPDAVIGLALATLIFVVVLRLRPRILDQDRYFYAGCASFIGLSLPLLGVYLVFSLLIAPALVAAVRRPPPAAAPCNFCGAWVAVLGFVIGLALSAVIDWPAGPSVVLMMALMAGIGLALDSRRSSGQTLEP